MNALMTFLVGLLLFAGPDALIPRPVSFESDHSTYTPRTDGKDVRVRLGDRTLKRRLSGLPAFAAEEAYELRIGPQGIDISALTETGADRARQTLRQLELLSDDGSLECGTILDWPRFAWRGFMVDLSRHFRSKDFILKQLDAMALLRMNRLHLHLTDDAGWRMQVDCYPRLNTLGSWRLGDTWREWRDQGHQYLEEGTPGAYGGCLTKEELREIVAYAAARRIEVIPEIEMPGHSAEVLRAYPETACTDASGNPVYTSDVCPGSEATFALFEAVLDEVMDIFPSRLIHIGGDEASKASWRSCPRCRARMEAEGLSSVEELQSYLVRRMEKYLISKGRRLLGWDEIMEGGLAPEATVMSWRGTEQGARAAEMGHDVIFSPTSHFYLDYPQDDPLIEPEGFGSYLPLARTYSFDPPVEGAHILGVQGNLWAEMIPTDEHYEYMAYPRLLAVAEIGWTPQKERVWDDFRERALAWTDLLRRLGYNPFDLSREVGERPESQKLLEHLGRGAKVTYATPYSARYSAGGDRALTDGRMGQWGYSGNGWQGFSGDLDVTLDLGGVLPVHYVGATFYSSLSAWIAVPEEVEISVSTDGNAFRAVALLRRPFKEEGGTMYIPYGTVLDTNARYVRLRARRSPAPQHEWLFLDEVVVN